MGIQVANYKSQHGEYQIDICGQILVAKLTGSWNLDTDEAYFKDLIKASHTIQKMPWIFCADMTNWDLVVHEAFQEVSPKLAAQFLRENQIAEIWITPSTMTVQILQEVTTFPESVSFVHAKTVKEALAWIEKSKFTYNESQLNSILSCV
jgi:hypothetical protein